MLTSNLEVPRGFILYVPGDKSISHRSVLFSSLAKGKSKITGFLEAEDPLNTMKCFGKMGVDFQKTGNCEYTAISKGREFLKSPQTDLDFGNGGTGIRLSAGLISGLDGIEATLTGDASLRKRPMKRIIDPLLEMGANISSITNDGKAPLKIIGKKLKQYNYNSQISSAQVKSCLMLGSISSNVELHYNEIELSRDHTENMIRFLGGNIKHFSKTEFEIKPPFNFEGTEFKIPGDISSAAFFIVLGLISNKGEVIIKNVGLNPARIGILTVLKDMGGKIEIENERMECGEKVGDLKVLPSNLKKIEIQKELIPSIIDEIPILTIAGIFSEGGFEIKNSEELRAKESDRIHSMVLNLRNLGIDVEEYKDGYSFGKVSQLNPCLIQVFMDHRIAMSFYILKTLVDIELKIDDDSWIDTSFPQFKDYMRKIKG